MAQVDQDTTTEGTGVTPAPPTFSTKELLSFLAAIITSEDATSGEPGEMDFIFWVQRVLFKKIKFTKIQERERERAQPPKYTCKDNPE